MGRQTVLDVYYDSSLKILKARRALTGIVSTVVAMLGANVDDVACIGRDYYVTSNSNNIVMKAMYNSPGSYTVSIWAGTNGSAGTVDGVGTAAKFNNPRGITPSPDGKYLYVADLFGFRIRRIEVATVNVVTVAGNNTGSDVDGAGSNASFANPTGLTVDPTGQILYITTFAGLRQMAIATANVTTLVSGEQAYDVAIIGTRLYYTTPAHYLKSIKLDGSDKRIEAGTGAAGSVDGFGPGASLNQAWGLAYDGVDALYLASYSGHKIRTFNPITTEVRTLAGSGTAGSVDGNGAAATFNAPNGVCLDNEGRLIIAQNGNTNLRAIV